MRAQFAQQHVSEHIHGVRVLVCMYTHVHVCRMSSWRPGVARTARPEAQNFRGALRARNFWGMCEQGRNFWMGVRTDRPEFMF